MIVTLVSTILAAKPKSNLPRTMLVIRVVGLNGIRIGKTRDEVETQIGTVNDGIELLPGDPPFVAWWAGDLYAIAATATPATFVVIEASTKSQLAQSVESIVQSFA